MIEYFTPSTGLLFVPLILQLIMFVLAQPIKTYRNPQLNTYYTPNSVFFVFFICQALALIFAFDSDDFFSYISLFKTISSETTTFGFEPIYNWLASFTGDFIVWRSIIWGTSVFFLYLIAKRLDLINRNLLLAIALWGFVLNYYTRGLLGHTMLLVGFVLLIDKKSGTFDKILGLVLFASSYFFHKSMYVNIAFALLALFPQFSKKNIIIVSLVAFPFLTTAATWLVDNVASGAIDVSFNESVEGVSDRTQYYVTGERHDVSIMGIIGLVILLTPEYLAVLYLIDKVVFKRYFEGIKRERIFTCLFRLSYVAIYIASLFAFVETDSWIYMRFKYMAFFPLVFVLAKVWSMEPRSNKWIKAIIILQMFSFFWKWLYRIYRSM